VEPLPDMKLSSVATPPSSPVSPRVAIALAAGVIVGLLLGVAAAFVREFFDVRLRQEEQLRELFRLPILARVPRERGLARRPGLQALWGSGRSFSPLTAAAFDAVALESFRTLGAMLVSARPNGTGKRSVLITSASAGDGKTTTALNLASSLAAAGSEVILIEGDLRRPSIGKALGVSSGAGLLSVLTGQASVSSALVRSPTEPTLRYLLADHGRGPDPMIANALFLPTAATVLARALEFADYVIVDAPPLAEVIDALEIASQVDDVLIAVRLGHTRRPQLVRLGELLSRSHIVPAGLVVLGVPPPRGDRAYRYGYRPYAYSTGDQETAAAGQTGAPTPAALSREEVLRPERSSEGRPSAPLGVEGRLRKRS
jgi:Mrp family chromosome partitioning ATPase